jgi:hypothetical protein
MLLLAAYPAQAQLGGLKKKVADKVAGKKPDTTVATTAGSGKPKCDKSSMVITADVVDRYLKGFAAQEAERRRMAREKGPVGEYYAAYFRKQEAEHRKQEFDLRRGNDWERYKVIYPKFVKGDQAAMAQNQALQDSLDPNKVQLPVVDWTAQTQHDKRLDSVAIAASGFSACDWGAEGLGERIPMMVRLLLSDPNTKDFQGYGTQAEGAAVKSRLKELADAMGYGTRRGERAYTEAEKAHIKDEDEKLQRLAMLTGDPYTDCATGVQTAFMKKHQAEFDKLQKQQDMAASQRLSMELMQETDKECKKYSKDKDDE